MDLIHQILDRKPIVHCITNIVTVNDCANVLLAIGASPTMAHHEAEVAEIQRGSSALVCNLGATENYEAMLVAAAEAEKCNHPVVIDPVGCGGSSFRREFFKKLVNVCKPACIRGNYSEIIALARDCATVTGVDSGKAEDCEYPIEHYAVLLSQNTGAVVVASGKTDVIAHYQENKEAACKDKEESCKDKEESYFVTNINGGDIMMSRITGAGCMLSSMMGAYLAIQNSADSVLMCCENMKRAAEIAGEVTRQSNGGTMVFKDRLIDGLYIE